MNLLKLNITDQERKTFRLHMGFSLLEGLMAGVVVLNEFIFIKSMLGSSYMLSFLWQFSMMVLLPTIIINEFVRRTKNKKKLLRLASIITRAPLLILLLFPSDIEVITSNIIYHYIFLGLFLNYYLAWPIIFPTINLYLKNSYSHENFSKLFSYATSAKSVVTMIGTFLFGLLLDHDPFSFRYIYPVIGITGVISVILLSKISFQIPEGQTFKKDLRSGVVDSLKRAWTNVWRNKGYRDFELAFMFYGFAFMVTVSVITIFLEKEMHLNYSSLAFYKNGAVTISILLLPFFGKRLGKIDPRRFGVIPLLSLALYLVFILLAEYYPVGTTILGIQIYYPLVLAFIFFGLFASTMTLLWSIGSAYFCKDEDAGDYQAVHLSLTGFRASFSPILGIFFFELFGYTTTFVIGIIALLLGVWVFRWSIRHRTV
jgi:MFS family permease